MRYIKCVVVGDGAVGKTHMLITFTTKEFPQEYVPTVFEHYIVNYDVGNVEYKVGLFDTASQAEYDQLRPLLSYPDADVFLVCFSTVSPYSLESVLEKWIPEIEHYSPNTPFLLVGTQTDLREDEKFKENEAVIKHKMGEKLRKKVKAVKYVECSALTQEGIDDVFHEAFLAVINQKKPNKRNRCKIQ